MLEFYYTDSRIINRMRRCLLGQHMDELAQKLHEQGYSKQTARTYLRTAAHWSRYAEWSGISQISQMNSAAAVDFLENHLPNCACERMNCGKYAGASAGVQYILEFLQGKGLIEPEAPPAEKQDMLSETLRLYDEYLDRVFGLCEKTRNVHRRNAMLFMQWITKRRGCLELSELRHEDIAAYQVSCEKNGYSFDWKRTLTSCLRGFVRFLIWKRILKEDLTSSVNTVRQWSLATIPKYMPFENIRLLLQAPDRNTVTGKRDLAMMMLLAYLGLRANEVVNLCVEDIDFRNGQITIRKTKTHNERVQVLTVEIAEVLIDYLKNRGGNFCEQQVFLKTMAPHTPLIAASAVGSMVRKYIVQSGIKTPTHGTHQFRHSLATHLINNGVSMKEIADLLGHTAIQSTAIYAKVQLERLKDVALPFPCVLPEGRRPA